MLHRMDEGADSSKGMGVGVSTSPTNKMGDNSKMDEHAEEEIESPNILEVNVSVKTKKRGLNVKETKGLTNWEQ